MVTANRKRAVKKKATGTAEKNGNGSLRLNSMFSLNAALLTRTAAITRLLDPRRDIDLECGYPKDILPEQYRLLFDREGIAKRVVTVYPDESWAQDPEILESNEAEETVFEKAWKELQTKNNVHHYLHRIDRLSGVGQYGVILFGLADGKPLTEPVDGIDPKGMQVGKPSHKLLFLRVFDERNARISVFEKDMNNPRFGQPVLYDIEFEGDSGASRGERVHWSRVLHVADNRESSEVYGIPRMQSVYNRIYDLRKLYGGSGEMFWKGGFPGFIFEVDPAVGEFTFGEEEKRVMREEFENYSNGLQRYMATMGVRTKQLSPQVADPSNHIEAQIKAIAITIGVPLRIFVGSEAAHLASTQDKFVWNTRLNQRKTKYLTPMLVRPFVDRLIILGVLPQPEEYTVFWPDLLKLTSLEKAEVGEKLTKAITTYVQSGSETLIPPIEFFTKILDISLEDAEAIVESANEQIGEEDMEEEE